MAIGDKAAAAGLKVYASSQDRRLGYENDNQRGDEIADVMGRAKKLEDQVVRHAEFTTSNSSVPYATVTGCGSVSRVTAGTTDASIATPLSNTATANGVSVIPGVYAITWQAKMSASAVGRTFIEVANAATNEIYLRQSIVRDEDQGGIAVPSLNIASTTSLVFRIYQIVANNATISVTGSLRITRWR